MSLYERGTGVSRTAFDTRRLADRIEEPIVRDHIGDDDRAFIERRTCSSSPRPTRRVGRTARTRAASPGFVRVLDEQTVAFPSYDGNGLYLSMGEHAREPERRPALHQLRGALADAAERHRVDRPGPDELWRPGGAVRRPRSGTRGVPELPAVHPRVPAREAVAVRAQGGVRDAGAGLECGATGRRTSCPSTTPRDPSRESIPR